MKRDVFHRWCGSADHVWNPNRREFLLVGTISGLGLTLGRLFQLQAAEDWKDLAQPSKEGKAKSVINIFLPGGLAQQESWDPKYLAPVKHRGPFGTVKTALPGVHLSENLPETAKVADKITIVRSMTHGEAAHERGTHNMMTGVPSRRCWPDPVRSEP
jgi:hypothetical protein